MSSDTEADDAVTRAASPTASLTVTRAASPTVTRAASPTVTRAASPTASPTVTVGDVAEKAVHTAVSFLQVCDITYY